MRKTPAATCMLVAVALLGAGCSRNATVPTGPTVTRDRGLNVSKQVQLHGVLQVPSPSSPGPQGRLTPWLVGDDGAAYDLVLDLGFEPLSDPGSTGRGVSISGNMTLQFPSPVGAEPIALHVTAFSFD